MTQTDAARTQRQTDAWWSVVGETQPLIWQLRFIFLQSINWVSCRLLLKLHRFLSTTDLRYEFVGFVILLYLTWSIYKNTGDCFVVVVNVINDSLKLDFPHSKISVKSDSKELFEINNCLFSLVKPLKGCGVTDRNIFVSDTHVAFQRGK